MHWVIRWVDEASDQDMAAVVDAPTREDAEAAAREQGIPFLLIARACRSDLADARAAGLTARRNSAAKSASPYPGTATNAHRHTCLGRHVGHAQLAAILLAGVATAILHLRPILPAIVS